MIRVSNLGLWEDPYNDVIVPSRNITMQGVDNYVLAKSGKHHEIMVPGLDYKFDGHVFEHPLLENGEKSNILSKILNKSHYADGGEKKFSKLKEKDMSKSLNKKSLENDTQGVTMENYVSNQRNDFVSRLKENNMNAIADESFDDMVNALYGFSDNKQQVAQNGTEKTVYVDNVPYTYVDRLVEPWWSWNDHYVARDENGNKVKIRKDLMTKVNAQGNPYLPYYKSIVGGRLNFANYPYMISGHRRDNDPLFAEGKKVGIISNQPYTITEEQGRKIYSPQKGESLTIPTENFFEIDDEGDIHELRADAQFVTPWNINYIAPWDKEKYEFDINKDYSEDPFEPLRNLTGVRTFEKSEAFGNDVKYEKGVPKSDKWNLIGIPFSYGAMGDYVYPYEELKDSSRFVFPVTVYPKQQTVQENEQTTSDQKTKQENSTKDIATATPKENTKAQKTTTQIPVSKKEPRLGKKLRAFKYQGGGELDIRLPHTEYNIPGINAINDNMRTAGIRRMQFNGPDFDNFSLGRFNMRNYTNENNELDIDAINKSDKFQERGLRLGTDETGQIQLFDKNGNIVDSNMKFKGRIPKGTAYAMTNIALNSVPVMSDIVDRIRAPREMYYSERSQPNLYGNNYGDYALNSGIIDEFTIG